jgi:hypothetical protein
VRAQVALRDEQFKRAGDGLRGLPDLALDLLAEDLDGLCR